MYMKHSMMILAAALMSLCMTACGTDNQHVDDALSDSAVTSQAAETAPAESAVTEAAVTEAPAENTAAAETETAAQTDAVQTAASDAEPCRYSAADLVGEWAMPGTFGSRNNTMTVTADGSVILRYAAGGTRTGKLRIDREEHPDGTGSFWYSVYGDDNTAWIGFACAELPVNRIASGQDGEMEFVRVSLEDVAAEKMNNMNFLMRSMSGGGGDLATDPESTVTVDGQTYTRVTDERFAIGTLGKAAFERLLEETASGKTRTDWQKTIDAVFTEQDGQTYVLTSGAHGFQTFETGHGVTITEQTETSFDAATKDENQLDGRGYAHFVFDGVNWTIESYEFR